MSKIKTRAQTIEVLTNAIAAHSGDTTGPGTWEAQNFYGAQRDCVALTYSVKVTGEGPMAHPDLVTGDEPWKNWGGDAILAAAKLVSFDGAGESYTDKCGDEIYADSALIEVSDDIVVDIPCHVTVSPSFRAY